MEKFFMSICYDCRSFLSSILAFVILVILVIWVPIMYFGVLWTQLSYYSSVLFIRLWIGDKTNSCGMQLGVLHYYFIQSFSQTYKWLLSPLSPQRKGCFKLRILKHPILLSCFWTGGKEYILSLNALAFLYILSE